MRRPGKPFSEYCRDGDEHGVRQWLEWIHERPDRSQHLNVPAQGYTGLMKAVENGHNSIVRLLLLEPGLDFNHVGEEDGSTAMHLAVVTCNLVALDLLLAQPKGKVNWNIKDSSSENTPLMAAALKHCHESFRKLVFLEDIDLDVKDKRGRNLKDVVIAHATPKAFLWDQFRRPTHYTSKGCTKCRIRHTVTPQPQVSEVKVTLLSEARLKKVRLEKKREERGREEEASERRRQMDERRAAAARGDVDQESKRKNTNGALKKVIKDNEEKMDMLLKENEELMEKLVKESKEKEDKLFKENKAKEEKLVKENKAKKEKMAKENKERQIKLMQENEGRLEEALQKSENAGAPVTRQALKEDKPSASAPDCPVGFFYNLNILVVLIYQYLSCKCNGADYHPRFKQSNLIE